MVNKAFLQWKDGWGVRGVWERRAALQVRDPQDAARTEPVSASDKVPRCCNPCWRRSGCGAGTATGQGASREQTAQFLPTASGACEINCACERLTVLRISQAGRKKGKDKKAERPLGWYYFIFIFSPRQEGTEGMTAGLEWWATRCPSQPPKMNSPNKSDQPVLMKRLVQCRIVMVFHRLSSSWPALVLFLPLRMIHLSSGTITGTHDNRDPHRNKELELK